MSLWYAICDALPLEMLHWDFMKNALLALLLMAPLFGILSTMIVTGHMSFFSDALGHSAFTGIALGSLFGIAAPTWAAVAFSVFFALLFSYLRRDSNQAADTLIGVFSSAAVALGILVATMGKLSKKDIEDMKAFLARYFTPEQIAKLLGEPELLSDELVAQFFGGQGVHICFRASVDLFAKP